MTTLIELSRSRPPGFGPDGRFALGTTGAGGTVYNPASGLGYANLTNLEQDFARH